MEQAPKKQSIRVKFPCRLMVTVSTTNVAIKRKLKRTDPAPHLQTTIEFPKRSTLPAFSFQMIELEARTGPKSATRKRRLCRTKPWLPQAVSCISHPVHVTTWDTSGKTKETSTPKGQVAQIKINKPSTQMMRLQFYGFLPASLSSKNPPKPNADSDTKRLNFSGTFVSPVP